MADFPTFFFRQCRPGECFLRYSRKKEGRFWAIKTRSSKSQKLDNFPKGLTHGFGPKKGHFSNFFLLGSIGQENVFYDILEQKKRPF